jgi:hypothetical protein
MASWAEIYKSTPDRRFTTYATYESPHDHNNLIFFVIPFYLQSVSVK